MTSPPCRLLTARCSTACFERMASVLVLTTLGQSLQYMAEAAAVTTTRASSKPAIDCSNGMVSETCMQRGESPSSRCYCVDGIARYCSDICDGASKSQLCAVNCPEFSEHGGLPSSLPIPTNDLPIGWIVGPVLAFVLIVIIVFSVTFTRYKRRVVRTEGAPSFRGYLRFLRSESDEVVTVPTQQDNSFPDVERNGVDNNSDNPMTPLHRMPSNESVNGTTAAGSGLAHD